MPRLCASLRPRRRAGGGGATALSCALAVGLSGVASGCAVPRPTAREVLGVGFETPRQAYETFRTAFRGDLPDLEYRCFSEEFRHRNRLSQMAYREFRDRLFERIPFLRLALHRAELVSLELLDKDRARILSQSLGRTLVVDLVREDFWEIRLGPAPEDVDGGYLDDLWEQGYLQVLRDDPVPRLVAQVPLELLARPGLADEVQDLRLGREWKIDDFQVLDEPPPKTPPPPHEPAPPIP